MRRRLLLLLLFAVPFTLAAAAAAPGAPARAADALPKYRDPAYEQSLRDLLEARWPNSYSDDEAALGAGSPIRLGLWKARVAAGTLPPLTAAEKLRLEADGTLDLGWHIHRSDGTGWEDHKWLNLKGPIGTAPDNQHVFGGYWRWLPGQLFGIPEPPGTPLEDQWVFYWQVSPGNNEAVNPEAPDVSQCRWYIGPPPTPAGYNCQAFTATDQTYTNAAADYLNSIPVGHAYPLTQGCQVGFTPATSTYPPCLQAMASDQMMIDAIDQADFQDYSSQRVTFPVDQPIGYTWRIGWDVDAARAYLDTDPQTADWIDQRLHLARRPLIFLPGIMGTNLAKANEELWPNAQQAVLDLSGDHFLGALQLGPDGISDADGVPAEVSGLVGHLQVFFGSHQVYDSHHYDLTISYLQSKGYVLGKTLFAYPFDWRKSAAVNVQGLAALVEQIHATTGSKVDILAHSQGGLVALEMLREGATADINRLVTFGTPVLGAPKAFGVMEQNAPCIVPDNWLIGCAYDSHTVADITRTMPGVYELLPSPQLEQLIGPPLYENGQAVSFPAWTDSILANGSPAFLDGAESFHAAIDSYQPSVPMLRIFGSGLPTPYAFFDLDGTSCWQYFQTCRQEESAMIGWGTGDGTVPAASAADAGSGVPESNAGAIAHDDLVHASSSLDAALAFLTAPTARVFNARRLAQAADIDALSGIAVDITGSAHGSIEDAVGRTDAIDPSLPVPQQDIPGSTVLPLTNDQAYFFSDPGSYTASYAVDAQDAVRVSLRRYADGGVAEQATFVIPDGVRGSTFSLVVGGNALADVRVAVDIDGNGTTDERIEPLMATGAAADDHTAPRTAAGANLDGLGTSQVTLQADDADSGVAATYYSLPGATTPSRYTGPFDAPIGSTIQYRSIDNAGNLEDVQSLLVDDASNLRQFGDTLTPFKPILRFIDPQGDVDWFRFDANGTSRYRVQLYQLPKQYDLQLFDADGNPVAVPKTRGRDSVELFEKLAAGTYYVEVSAAPDAPGLPKPFDHVHPYGLQLLAVPGR